MIRRRDFIIGAGFLLFPQSTLASAPVPAGGRLAFDVFRKNNRIGTHELTFRRNGDRLTVNVDIELAVGLGPITLYRYRHRITEVWQGTNVVSLAAETNDNGEQLRVTVERTPSGLAVEGTKVERYIAPPDAHPTTHWNRAMLNGPIINTQTGELMRPAVTPQGEDRIVMPNGSVTVARRYALRGPVTFDTWYNDGPEWVSLIFTAEDGTQILYRRA